MVPPRPSGPHAAPPPARRPDPPPASVSVYELIKTRVLAKLEDRMDPSASKRMPASLLRQSLRTFAEQIAEQDARTLPKPDRDRLIEEVLAELLGYGPLEELFNDPAVREVMVAGPSAVIVRRASGNWVPTHIRFHDDDHLRTALDRLATHADPVGGATTSVNLYDLKLPNGFRAVAVIPPPALGVPASVAFVRVDAVAATAPPATPAPEAIAGPASGRFPGPGPTGSASAGTRPVPGSPTASPRPGSGLVRTPLPRQTDPPADPLTRHRNRIIERLITRLASLGVYDLQRVEITELRRAVAAYVSEYCEKENIYLSDTDQGRLMLEILAAMNR